MRILIPLFTALALLLATATSAEPGLGKECAAARPADEQAVPEDSASDASAATAGDSRAASSDVEAAMDGMSESEKRALVAFVLMAAIAPRGTAP